MTARDLISDWITPLNTLDTNTFVLAMMDEYKLTHLPVSENGIYLGLISESDILSSNNPVGIVEHFLPDLSGVHVKEDQHMFEAISTMAANQLTLLPVTDQTGHYIGSITSANMLRHLSEIFAVDNPGAVVILDVSEKDYLLTEIAQIVESNECKVLSMYIRTSPDSNRLEITLKLNRLDIAPVLQTFYRYNYNVKATYTENSNQDDLMDRFNSLLKYLNV